MADFCNQCAKALGFPEGDFLTREKLPPDSGYAEICEGCGPTFVDEVGNCIAYRCLENHGATAVGKKIQELFQTELLRTDVVVQFPIKLLNDIATEQCGKNYDFFIMQIHDSFTVKISPKELTV